MEQLDSWRKPMWAWKEHTSSKQIVLLMIPVQDPDLQNKRTYHHSAPLALVHTWMIWSVLLEALQRSCEDSHCILWCPFKPKHCAAWTSKYNSLFGNYSCVFAPYRLPWVQLKNIWTKFKWVRTGAMEDLDTVWSLRMVFTWLFVMKCTNFVHRDYIFSVRVSMICSLYLVVTGRYDASFHDKALNR